MLRFAADAEPAQGGVLIVGASPSISSMPTFNRSATDVRPADICVILRNKGLSPAVEKALIRALPDRAVGVVLYGSQARGDATSVSDVDLLVVADHHSPSRAVDIVNVATYDVEQFESARGTLFGMHVARDGLVLHDAGGLQSMIESFGPIDTEQLWKRLSALASILKLPFKEQLANLPGFVRHARYVLRTATYAQAIGDGNPCFSVAELSERFNDPNLKVLLSSHPDVQGPPSTETLKELARRVMAVVPNVADPVHSSLADLIVAEQATRPELADSAVMILGRSGDGPYTEIPRVIL